MTDKIIEIISEVLETTIDTTTSQINCEKWDSLHHLQIIVALEEAFDLSFEPEEIAEMKSIVAIESMVKTHQK
jgi:acyl carrier protein